jgi:hypothetical protein
VVRKGKHGRITTVTGMMHVDHILPNTYALNEEHKMKSGGKLLKVGDKVTVYIRDVNKNAGYVCH